MHDSKEMQLVSMIASAVESKTNVCTKTVLLNNFKLKSNNNTTINQVGPLSVFFSGSTPTHCVGMEYDTLVN